MCLMVPLLASARAAPDGRAPAAAVRRARSGRAPACVQDLSGAGAHTLSAWTHRVAGRGRAERRRPRGGGESSPRPRRRAPDPRPLPRTRPRVHDGTSGPAARWWRPRSHHGGALPPSKCMGGRAVRFGGGRSPNCAEASAGFDAGARRTRSAASRRCQAAAVVSGPSGRRSSTSVRVSAGGAWPPGISRPAGRYARAACHVPGRAVAQEA